jgi:hypothetical protein
MHRSEQPSGNTTALMAEVWAVLRSSASRVSMGRLYMLPASVPAYRLELSLDKDREVTLPASCTDLGVGLEGGGGTTGNGGHRQQEHTHAHNRGQVKHKVHRGPQTEAGAGCLAAKGRSGRWWHWGESHTPRRRPPPHYTTRRPKTLGQPPSANSRTHAQHAQVPEYTQGLGVRQHHRAVTVAQQH